MALQNLPQTTVATDNIQNQADQVVGQAAQLKLSFDTYGIDSNTYINTILIPALQSIVLGDSGANTIGYAGVPGATSVADAIDILFAAGIGTIPPDNTITTAKIVDLAVTTAKIDDEAVTTIKLADESVTNDKLSSDVSNAIAANAYNIYGLQLSQYYEGISYLHRLGILDGFINTDLSDVGVTTADFIDTVNKYLHEEKTIDLDKTTGKTNDNFFGRIGANSLVGQSITMTGDVGVDSITFKLFKVGSPADNIVIDMYTVSADIPDTLIASSDPIVGSTLPLVTATEIIFNFPTKPSVTNGVRYAFVLRRTGAFDNSNYYKFIYGNTIDDINGNSLFYDGATWTFQADDDMALILTTLKQVEPVYQTIEQDIAEDFKDVVLYISVKKEIGESINPQIDGYTTTPEGFIALTNDATYSRDVGDGYTEFKYTHSFASSKQKLKIKIDTVNLGTLFVREYGVIVK